MSSFLPSIAGVIALNFLITKLMINFSYSIGLVDHPDQRKRHTGSIPLIGGISIYFSVVIGATAFLNLPDHFITIALICGCVTLVSALDDRFPLHPVYRLIIQLMAGLAIASVGQTQIISLGNIVGLGEVQLGLVAIPFTAVAITGICNAYNMTDGIDGLAGSLALIPMVSLLYLTWGEVPENELALIAYFCASIVVFLIYNLEIRPLAKRKIFMGDAGSMFIGMSTAIAMIYFSQSREIIEPATALWLVAVPLMDMLSTIIRRTLKGQAPFRPDRTHIHHILLRAGLSQRQALLCICSLAVLLAAIGIFLEKVWPQHEAVSFGLFILVAGLYFYLIINHAFLLTKKIRRFRRKNNFLFS